MYNQNMQKEGRRKAKPVPILLGNIIYAIPDYSKKKKKVMK